MKFFNKSLALMVLTVVMSLFSVSIVFAAPSDVTGLILLFRFLIRLLIPIVVAAALLFFFWGLAKFIWNSSNEVEKEKGKDIMVWGIIALFVMVSVWGLVGFLNNSFVDRGSAPDTSRLLPSGS